MLPDIPAGWQTALAAAGAVLVVILVLKWTGAILSGHGKISELLINRSYDIADSVLAKMAPEAVESDPPGSTASVALPPLLEETPPSSASPPAATEGSSHE